MLLSKLVFGGEEKLSASLIGRRSLMIRDGAMWEFIDEVDPDDIRLLVLAIVCLVGSFTALLVHYFYG
jgi:hypothetical protein